MAKGEDTMVSENQREEITVSDGLQLGRSTVDTTDIKTAEDEVNTLQKQVNEVSCPLSLPSPLFHSLSSSSSFFSSSFSSLLRLLTVYLSR